MQKIITAAASLWLAGCLTQGDSGHTPGPDAVGARLLPVTEKGRQRDAGAVSPAPVGAYDLYTASTYQYAAFIDDAGHLTLAQRRLGEDQWEGHRSSVQVASGEPDFLVLAVDGEGYLQVAWGEPEGELGYAVSDEPGSLGVSEEAGMTGENEEQVEDAHLFRQPDGNLLFAYRDGRNRLVLNHYETEQRDWSRLQTDLIGTEQGASEWDMYQQQDGTLHLAWRYEGNAPDDVTAVHYARSDDGGARWRGRQGDGYSLPLNTASPEVAWTAEKSFSSSVPVQITSDPDGVPYIGVSQSGENGADYRIVHRSDERWDSMAAPDPVSSAMDEHPDLSLELLAEAKDGKTRVHLLYPDRASPTGSMQVSSTEGFESPQWDHRHLTDRPAHDWVPAVDVPLWQRMRQAHFLRPGRSGPGLDLVIWSPDWEHHLSQYAADDTDEAPERSMDTHAQRFEPDTILDYAERVARWQWDHMPDPEGWHFEPRAWGVCPLYIGTLDIAPHLEEAGFDGAALNERMRERARELEYGLRDDSPYDADDYCVTQAYLRLYKKHQDPDMIADSQARFDKILANPPAHNLDWGYPHSRERWSWSDALYMGPMSWLMMWEATGDEDYLAFMNREWWAATERLYRPEIGLYFRDESYLDLREKNGQTIHWARGTSWSFAGLAQVIERFPKDHPDYDRYLDQYREMARAFINAQQDDGLWRPGLLDPETHNARETSGTAFIAFGLAKGLNLGLIDEEPYRRSVQKAWRALTASVADSGKLRNVQPVGAGPHGFDPDNAEPFASGAFLQLAAELYRMEAQVDQRAFEVEDPDFEQSPHTGMTRDHWQQAARYLLEGAFEYVEDKDDPMLFPKQPGKSYPRDGVHTPTSRLEELARTLLTAVPLLRENPDMEIGDIRLAEYYRHHIAKLVDENSGAFIEHREEDQGPHQNLVEFGALSMAFLVAPEVLWEPLSQADRDALAATMLSYGEGPTVPSNWKFFNIFVLSFLDSRGYDIDRSTLEKYLTKSLDDYRGEGWYNDNPAYDYYSMWGYQFYGMLWSELYGEAHYPDIAGRFADHFGAMADTYPHLFSEDGEMIMWGRSIAYRFASVSPLPLLDFSEETDVNAGWMRRIASGTLLQFLEHPDFLKDALPTLGFYGPFEPAVQQYSTRGSAFWSGKAFFALLLPEESPFWSDTENEGPWETDYRRDEVHNRFHDDSNILITNYPGIGGSEIRAWCHVEVIDNWEAFRGSENYNRLAYHSEFPWQADGEQGEVAMNYVVENGNADWEALRLFDFDRFEDGVYYREAVLETDDRVQFQLADMPLPNGVLRVDRNTSETATRFRLGHYALPDRGDGIEHSVKQVDGHKVHLLDNGEYQLAMVPLTGWDGIEAEKTRALHPQSTDSAVLNVEAADPGAAGDRSLYAALMLWKRSGESWRDEELLPVTAVKAAPGGASVRFRDGRERQIHY